MERKSVAAGKGAATLSEFNKITHFGAIRYRALARDGAISPLWGEVARIQQNAIILLPLANTKRRHSVRRIFKEWRRFWAQCGSNSWVPLHRPFSGGGAPGCPVERHSSAISETTSPPGGGGGESLHDATCGGAHRAGASPSGGRCAAAPLSLCYSGAAFSSGGRHAAPGHGAQTPGRNLVGAHRAVRRP